MKKQTQAKHPNSVIKPGMSAKEKRRALYKWVDVGFLHRSTGKSAPVGGRGDGQVAKVMSNADRRRLGIEQDSSLEDYQV